MFRMDELIKPTSWSESDMGERVRWRTNMESNLDHMIRTWRSYPQRRPIAPYQQFSTLLVFTSGNQIIFFAEAIDEAFLVTHKT